MTPLARAFAEARLRGDTIANAPPLSLDDGYAIADAAALLLGDASGWKVGATNAAGQQFLGVNEPICGRIVRSGIVHSCETLMLPGARDAEAEPELLFLLERPVDPGTDPADCIAAVHLGIEINRASHDAPFEQGVGFIVADNAAHCGLVIGPQIDRAQLDNPAAIWVSLGLNGEDVQTGSAAAVLGNPLAALRWLARRRSLKAGDWIASGAITRSCRFAVGDSVAADFGPLGRVDVSRADQIEVMPRAGE